MQIVYNYKKFKKLLQIQILRTLFYFISVSVHYLVHPSLCTSHYQTDVNYALII